MNPLHVANEGKVVIAAPEGHSADLLEIMKENDAGRESAIIGRVVSDHPGKAVMQNMSGGWHIIDSLSGDQLPRIC